MQTQQTPTQSPPSHGEALVIRRLRRHGFRYLHVIDALTLYGLMVLITMARFGFDWPTYARSHYLVGFGVATAIHMTVYYFGGMYEYEQRLGLPPWLPKVTLLTSIAVLASAAAGLVTGRYLMPRGNLFALLLLATLAVALNRWIARRLRSGRYGSSRILLVGNPDDIELARRHLAESGGDATVVGQTAVAEGLLDEVAAVRATDVLLLSGDSLDLVYPNPLEELADRKVGVFYRISPSDTLLGLQRSRQIAGMPFVSLRAHAVPDYRLRLKRVLELVVLMVLSPVLMVLVPAVALYVRLRVGKRHPVPPGTGGASRAPVRRWSSSVPCETTRKPGAVPCSPMTTTLGWSPGCGGSARADSTSCPSCGTSSGARCRSSGPVPNAPSSWPRSRSSFPATGGATTSRPGSPAWPRSEVTTRPTPATSSATTSSTS